MVSNGSLVVAVGLLLIGPGVNGVHTRHVLGRVGSIEQADIALSIRVSVTLYYGMGVLVPVHCVDAIRLADVSGCREPPAALRTTARGCRSKQASGFESINNPGLRSPCR